jgi:hypothetical protein
MYKKIINFIVKELAYAYERDSIAFGYLIKKRKK